MPVVGLDLGSQNIKAVEIEEQKGKFVLKKVGSHSDPDLNLSSSEQKDWDKYAAALRKFFSETGFSTPQVVIPLAENDVFLRVVKLPQMSEKELRSSITYEAEQYIPIPIKEVNFDIEILDKDPDDKDKMNVLMVAARKSVISKYVYIMEKAGLSPKAIEPAALALGRVFAGTISGPGQAVIILQIGATDSQMVIESGGAVRFTRSINVGGADLTKAVEQSLGFDTSQAEEYKKTYGLDSRQAEGKVAAAIKPVFERILGEVKRARIFYTTHNPSVMINRVVIGGGTALMPGLLFHVANHLDIEVELANPWRNIEFSRALEAQKDHIIEQGPTFVTAVGLALRELKGQNG